MQIPTSGWLPRRTRVSSDLVLPQHQHWLSAVAVWDSALITAPLCKQRVQVPGVGRLRKLPLTEVTRRAYPRRRGSGLPAQHHYASALRSLTGECGQLSGRAGTTRPRLTSMPGSASGPALCGTASAPTGCSTRPRPARRSAGSPPHGNYSARGRALPMARRSGLLYRRDRRIPALSGISVTGGDLRLQDGRQESGADRRTSRKGCDGYSGVTPKREISSVRPASVTMIARW